MTEATSVLVVANETLVGDELVDSLRRRAEHGPVTGRRRRPGDATTRGLRRLSRLAEGGSRLAGSTAFWRGCASRASRRTAPCTTTIR